MLVTKKAPNFKALAVMGDNSIKEVSLAELNGKNGLVIFFYPKDFTFVCPSEIIAFDNKYDEFVKRGYNVVGASCDSEYVHLAWKNTPIEKGGIGKIQFPLLSDIRKQISRDYDVLVDDAVSLRGSFLIDSNLVVRHAVINDLPLGRSIDEMIRMTDALDFFIEHGDVCPANWKKGQETIKPTSDGIASFLGKNSKNL